MLSCSAVDEAEAEEHLRHAYRVAGLEPPRLRWFDSPRSLVVFPLSSPHIQASLGKRVRNLVKEAVEDRIRDGVGIDVWGSVWDTIHDGERISGEQEVIKGLKKPGVLDLISHAIQGATSQSILESIPENVRKSPDMRLVGSRTGIANAYELAYQLAVARWFHECFEENDLIHLTCFNEMVSGYQLWSQEAWLVRKPICLELDGRGRLHSDSGLCIQYRDGWGFYAWHGVVVPERVILSPEHLTREDWLGEHTIELRRVLQERWGPEHFVKTIGGTCLDQGERGELIAVDLFDDPEGMAKYVRVRDGSTQRQYYLRVPPAIKRADEAVAWTFGLNEQDYQPMQES